MAPADNTGPGDSESEYYPEPTGIGRARRRLVPANTLDELEGAPSQFKLLVLPSNDLNLNVL